MPPVDEDIMRELMVRATADLFAPPAATADAIRRQRRHRVRNRALSAVGTAAAAGLAAGTIVATSNGPAAPGGSGTAAASGTSQAHPAQLTASQQTLFGLSSAAAARSRPSGRYVVLTEKVSTVGSDFSETGGKTSVIDTITGGGLEYQDLTLSGATKGVPVPPAVLKSAPGTSPTTRQLDAIPTGTSALRAYLLAQAKQQIAQANQFFQQQLKQAEKKNPALKGKKVIGQSPLPTDNDLVFEQAADTLWEPNLSPQLRSALYKVLAATPGVTVQTGARDSAGRPAVEISRTDTVGKTEVQTFENPKTGATLESSWRQASGELDEDLYLSISYTNTIPADPYQG